MYYTYTLPITILSLQESGLTEPQVLVSSIPDGAKATDRARTLFELSRISDRTTKFDEDIHTLDALTAGISGHAPITSRVIDAGDLPDRTFRDAWSDDGSTLAEDMPRARLIHMDRIRVARNTELAAKDITFMRAVESGDTAAQATIATEKQVLRDLPATFNLSGKNTSSTLHAAWPTELPARA
jgi:hypothetical protein